MMGIVITIALLFVGLAILIGGAEMLVRGAGSISRKMGIPPIVVGLTVVAFGTSAPELVINLFSALNGTTDIAIGNIIGSNIVNILFILGICALFANLRVGKNTVWKEIPFALLAVLFVFVMANDIFLDGAGDNVLTRTDGFALIGFFVIFLYYTFELFRGGQDTEPVDEVPIYSSWISTFLVIGGLVGLFFGGKLFVDQAIDLAKLAGLSEMLIGLTIVAIGTSLPELVTSIIATRKGQTDIAIGNIVGSNIFNIFWILGMTSVITPIPVSADAIIDISVCLMVTLVLFFSLFVGKKHHVGRGEGIVFLVLYIVYTGYLIMRG